MSRAATTKLKVQPITGSLPVLQYCAPEQLLIDESYQRSLEVDNSQSLIRRIAMYWDWGLCQPLFVARRGDGGLYVVDGQHRLAAARLRGDIAQLPCVVSHFDSAEMEAAAFVALNQQRRPLNALDLFKAALAAGDMEASQIKLCLEDAGLKLSNHANTLLMKEGHVANVGGLQRCYRTYGIVVLGTSLKVLAAAYTKQVLRYAGSIFPGIVAVVAGELNNRAAAKELIPELGAFVGSKPQIYWYKSFIQAVADDPNLSRPRAAEKILRGSWVEYSNPQHGSPPRQSSQAPAGESTQPDVSTHPAASAQISDTNRATFLKPAELAWCDQCDQRKSGAQAAACTSRFCSLKEAKAA
jgi:hypothetical protein